MSKLQETMQGIRAFFADVGGEMRKSSWPDRQELMSSTAVVIAAVVLLALFVGFFDKVLHVALRLLFFRS
jgi:preprotein translocase subunit SecE